MKKIKIPSGYFVSLVIPGAQSGIAKFIVNTYFPICPAPGVLSPLMSSEPTFTLSTCLMGHNVHDVPLGVDVAEDGSGDDDVWSQARGEWLNGCRGGLVGSLWVSETISCHHAN
jgi:hypothetical protein